MHRFSQFMGCRKPYSCAKSCGERARRTRRVGDLDGVSNFERFRQRVFEELDELEQIDRQHAAESFVEYGRQHGVDVITEVVDKGRSVTDVFAAIAKDAAKV